MNGKASCLLDISRFQGFTIFCGAGISKNSGLPLANELKRHILEKFSIDKKDVNEIMDSNLPFEAFMEIILESMDISKILDIYENGEPNTNHILIARLAKKGYLKTIFTTNFDLLIEKALEKEGLKRNKDFEVYYDEEQFSEIDFENIEDRIVKIFKIHGSVDGRDSIRTTMKAVASRTLSDKRINAIRYLFSTGSHKKVLVLGYSCSDEFDITPQIQSIEENQKEIIFIEHCKEGKEIEDVEIQKEKNPFKTFSGKRIKCNADDFIKDVWDSFKETIGEYKSIKSNVDWKTYLDDWAKELKEEYPKFFVAGLILYNISNFNVAIEYHEKSLGIAKAIGDKVGEAACYTGLGNAYCGLGDFKRAIEYYLKAEKFIIEIGQIYLLDKVYKNLAIAYEKIGDNEKAEDYKRKLSSDIKIL